MATMTRHIHRGLAALVLLAAAPAMAQVGGLSNPGSSPFTQNPEADRSKAVRKPSGLPGARAGQQGAVAPAERAAADLPPTEALFDAVNRGDIAGARDAISRGAELEGRNILGLTPLDLAIDLGRNDLTFLLLSMRGAASTPAPAAAPARPAQPVAAPRPAPVRAAAAAPAPLAAAPRHRTADAVGTPAPQAGFLGFGPTIR